MSHLTLVTTTDDPDVTTALADLGTDSRALIATLQQARQRYDQERTGDAFDAVRTATRTLGAERTKIRGRLDSAELWFSRSVPTNDVQRQQVREQEARWIALLRCYERCEDAIAEVLVIAHTERLAA